MNYIIILFGTAIIVAGIIILINPETVFGLIRRKTESLGLHLLAVIGSWWPETKNITRLTYSS